MQDRVQELGGEVSDIEDSEDDEDGEDEGEDKDRLVAGSAAFSSGLPPKAEPSRRQNSRERNIPVRVGKPTDIRATHAATSEEEVRKERWARRENQRQQQRYDSAFLREDLLSTS